MTLQKKINIFSIFITFIFFIEMVRKYEPMFASDYDTHWAYLAGTTFGIIDPKWVFPNWVYAPWYYMFCSYTFGPIFFFLSKINIIEIREAGMYAMLFGTFFIKILTIFGCYNFSKFLFVEKKLASIFSLLVVTLPFGNKSFYEHASETFGIMLLCWSMFFLISFVKKNKTKHLAFYLILFGLGSSLKMNILIPFFIFNFIFLFFYFNELKVKLFVFSIISVLLFLLLSKILIGNWLWENTDIRNFSRNYGEPPDIAVFFSFKFFNFFNEDLRYPSQSFSYWNTLFYDFFSDYFGSSFLKEGLGIQESYINLKIFSGILMTIVFFFYYFYIVLNSLLKLNFFQFSNIFNLSFLLMFVLSISYSYFVYHKMGGSWNLRYYGIFIFPLVYTIINHFKLIKNKSLFRFNYFFIFSLILFSIFQRINFNI